MNHPPIIHVTLREQARLGPRRSLDEQTTYFDAAKHRLEMRHSAEGVLVYERQFKLVDVEERGTKNTVEVEDGAPVFRTLLPWGIVKQPFYAEGATLEGGAAKPAPAPAKAAK